MLWPLLCFRQAGIVSVWQSWVLREKSRGLTLAPRRPALFGFVVVELPLRYGESELYGDTKTSVPLMDGRPAVEAVFGTSLAVGDRKG